MKNKTQVFDVDGEILKEGDTVILLQAPNELLSDLPDEDQTAINDQIGKTMSIQGFDEYSHVELEFVSEDEMMHFIWVDSSNLRKSAEKQ